jgi:hypothetical protein
MMGNLASDIDNAAFAGAVPDTTGLGVRFYKDVRQNEWKSQQEGRPIFEEVTMIHIVLPGNQLFDVKELVREDHKRRFPLQWAAFNNSQDGKDPVMIGTPLEQWPMIGRAQAEELKALRFYTVESIAQASDATLMRMGMAAGMAPLALRDRAIRFLEVAKGDAAVNKQAEEIDRLRKEQQAKDLEHAERLSKLQQQIDALAAASQPREKRAYHRKPKAEQQAA